MSDPILSSPALSRAPVSGAFLLGASALNEGRLMTFQADLEKLFGLKNIDYKYNLSKEELFHEAIKNDRGRVRKEGPSTAQKAFPTKLGVKGPLVYYTDPDCTGRRTKDTYAVR